MSYRPGRQTVTTTYPEFRASRVVDGRCPGCGVKVKRQRTFRQTASPYNTVADGSRPKTAAEVRAAVDAQADAWAPEPDHFRHDKCQPDDDEGES